MPFCRSFPPPSFCSELELIDHKKGTREEKNEEETIRLRMSKESYYTLETETKERNPWNLNMEHASDQPDEWERNSNEMFSEAKVNKSWNTVLFVSQSRRINLFLSEARGKISNFSIASERCLAIRGAFFKRKSSLLGHCQITAWQNISMTEGCLGVKTF